MWVQPQDPVGNIVLSTLLASLPILFLFYALAIKKMKGHLAGLLTLCVAVSVALLAYGMPVRLALLSTAYGMMTGMFPIGWIVLCAVFLYNLTVKTGQFEIIKDSIASITEDRRLQALLIAYSFGAFLEGAAGFGAPVAITAGMLAGLGFNPLYAAGICLIANTAPVAFGGIGIPIITASKVTGIDPMIISQAAAHQIPLLSFIVPFWLVFIMSGWKGTKEVVPAVLVCSSSFTVSMWLVAEKMGPMLPNIVSSLVSIIALIVFLKIWKPKNIWRFPNETPAAVQPKIHSAKKILRAWSPFIILTLFIGNWGIQGVKTFLEQVTVHFPFPVLNKAILAGGKPLEVVYHFNWLSAAGTAILIAAVVSALLLKISFGQFISVFGETLKNLRLPLLTVASVLGFAYIANYSGITLTLGKAMTVTGSFFPFVSPLLGWLGVFITGSDTSANALFCKMQQITAEEIGVNPVLTVTANTGGGVTAKMISPQSIAVACGSVGLVGKESDLFRFTIKHSLIFVFIMSILTYTQAYFLKWMIPEAITVSGHSAAPVVQTTTGSGLSVVLITAAVLLLLGILISRKGNSDSR